MNWSHKCNDDAFHTMPVMYLISITLSHVRGAFFSSLCCVCNICDTQDKGRELKAQDKGRDIPATYDSALFIPLHGITMG